MERSGIFPHGMDGRKVGGDILERFIGGQVDCLDLQRLHEALCLGIVVWVATTPHRPD